VRGVPAPIEQGRPRHRLALLRVRLEAVRRGRGSGCRCAA
jgi:hypothetical protein